MSALDEQIERLERRTLDPEVRRSPEQLDRLIADDFVEFGSSGRVFDKAAVLELLRSETPFRCEVRAFRVRRLAADAALATYAASIRATDSNEVRHSLRSSVWRFSDQRWQMVFHQGTPAEDAIG